jgi:hypothetical protein
MFCPNNFNIINKGDSIEKVTQLCGPPVAARETEDTSKLPQEWSYNTPPPFSGQGALNVNMSFNKGVVTSINTNQVGIGSTNACSQVINLGDSIEKVKRSCGQAQAISTGNGPGNVTKPQMTTEFKYTGPNGATLIFKDGKLTDRN